MVTVEEYRAAIRDGNRSLTDLQIELLCCRDMQTQKLTGRSEHEHRMAGQTLMFPNRIQHEFRERAFEGYHRVKTGNKKELMLLGSSNSNKTGSLADLAIYEWMVQPEATSIYITSPYEEASLVGIWARIIEQFDYVKAMHPELPGKLKESDAAIRMYERNPLSFIRVATVDQIGKLVGKKSQTFGVGTMIVIADELPEFKRGAEALIAVLKNLRSVPNFVLIGAGNFADVNDGLGQLAEPAIEGGYEVLNVDLDLEWETRRGGLAVRFDGHQSPNVKAGRDIIPIVTTIEYLKDLEKTEGGQNTPGYMRYGRSFPLLDANEFTVTNAVKVRAGGCYIKTHWGTGNLLFGAHLDPGFGGDPCMLVIWKTGIADVDGEELDTFELAEAPILIPIIVGAKDEFGNEMTVDDQIAVKTKAELDKRKIPYHCFSFDDSLRGGIVQAMMRKIGMGVVAISSGGSPTTRRLSALKQVKDPNEKTDGVKAKKVKIAKDEYANFATEMHFALASIIDSGQCRGLQLSREAVKQLCTRRWRWNGKKREVEPKVSNEEGARLRGWGYKLHSNGKSPNESDALVGGFENARRLGFRMTGLVTQTGGALEILKQIQREAQARHAMDLLKGNALPSGQLHSMESRTTSSRGRLNR